jgi:hypothetical protein
MRLFLRQRPVMPNIDPEVQKEAVKEALKEWLDEQFMMFGRWSFYATCAAAFAGLIYLALIGAGYHK